MVLQRSVVADKCAPKMNIEVSLCMLYVDLASLSHTTVKCVHLKLFFFWLSISTGSRVWVATFTRSREERRRTSETDWSEGSQDSGASKEWNWERWNVRNNIVRKYCCFQWLDWPMPKTPDSKNLFRFLQQNTCFRSFFPHLRPPCLSFWVSFCLQICIFSYKVNTKMSHS